ncbi:hypothetical protein OEZ86_009303 [Tetradesmus obliquus]|nr:hypothetical protein OEZ86_009303 [Tetradesmus obliquus]
METLTSSLPSQPHHSSSSGISCKQLSCKPSCLQQTAQPAGEDHLDDPMFMRASQVPSHLHDPHHDSRRPIFHPQSAKGWSSDPCGPIFYKGRYHLFYQHLRSSCQWYWGLCWDHLVSDDLVSWKHLPPAVIPTPGWFDADGCFSGTVEFDPELGVPVIMYTGVYLKANREAVAAHGLPPPGHDPGTRFVERQLAAVPADPDDPDLTVWRKLPEPVMATAPAGLNITCWRDPFCIARPAAAGGSGEEWVVGLASGVKGVGGAVLRFRSKHFTHGWQFDGFLAAAPANSCLTSISSSNSSSSRSSSDWFFAISPEACNFPITWWRGSYDGRSFDVAAADGPHKLDLGTTLYAATLWQDPKGRQLLYGWMQEHRRVPTPPALCEDFCYAGCIGTPRVLTLLCDRLYQTPLPEIDALRTRVSWHAQDLSLGPDGPLLPLQVVSGTHLDINISFQPPSTYTPPFMATAAADTAASTADNTAAAAAAAESARVGLIFKSWRPCGSGAAVLSFDWSTAALTVDFDEPMPDAYTPNPEDTPERKRVGGVLRNYVPGSPLSLRLLLDGSALEN